MRGLSEELTRSSDGGGGGGSGSVMADFGDCSQPGSTIHNTRQHHCQVQIETRTNLNTK